jgi:hypothetical protein
LNIDIVQLGRGFIPNPNTPAFADHRRAVRDGLVQAAEALASGAWDLDECHW